MFRWEKHGCWRMEGGRFYSCTPKGSCFWNNCPWSLEIRKSRLHTGEQEANYQFSSRWWIPETTGEITDLNTHPQRISMFMKWKEKSKNKATSAWGISETTEVSFLIAFLDLIQGNVIAYFDLSNSVSIFDWNLQAKLYRKWGKALECPFPKCANKAHCHPKRSEITYGTLYWEFLLTSWAEFDEEWRCVAWVKVPKAYLSKFQWLLPQRIACCVRLAELAFRWFLQNWKRWNLKKNDSPIYWAFVGCSHLLAMSPQDMFWVKKTNVPLLWCFHSHWVSRDRVLPKYKNHKL